MIGRILSSLFAVMIGFSAVAQQPTAESLYAQFQDRVMQVRIIDQLSGSKVGIGSGFVVSDKGLVVSNFHVVANLVNQPGRYHARYRQESGAEGELALVGIDVVHDLALLQSDIADTGYIEIAPMIPKPGADLYSLGNPHDLGLTIVQGTYSGLLERSLYDKVHFTGSINPGMSGGPALDSEGHLVGVNVATSGNQVSFLVPAHHVAALIMSGAEAAPIERLREAMAQQLLNNQQSYLSLLLEQPFAEMSFGNFQLPGQLASYLSCWGDSEEKDDEAYDLAYYDCSNSDDIFLSSSQSTGKIHYQHQLYSTKRLDPIRFYGMLETRMGIAGFSMTGSEETVDNFSCKDGFVSNQGINGKLVFCLRAYRKIEGLYDAFLVFVSLVADDQALLSTLILTGTSHDNAVAFAQSFVEVLSWSPGESHDASL